LQASTLTPQESDAGTIISTETLKGATIGSTDTAKASPKTRKKVEKSESKLLRKFDPKILPQELKAVHKCICVTRVPSWLTRVKGVVGTPGSCSLKAAEWLILYLDYFALTLIPIWEMGSGNPHWKALLASTFKLISLANFLTSQTVNPADLGWLSNTFVDYWTVLAQEWKSQPQCKPNLHLSQHYPEHINRFGTPSSTASWAHERLNGILGRVLTNNQMGIGF
jgi:hypothetical protein